MDVKFNLISRTSAVAPMRRANQTSETGQVETSDWLVRTSELDVAPKVPKFTPSSSETSVQADAGVLQQQGQGQNLFSSVAATGATGGLAASIANSQLHDQDGRWDLKALADHALASGSLKTEFPPEVKAQVGEILSQSGPTRGLRAEAFDSVDIPWNYAGALDSTTQSEAIPSQWLFSQPPSSGIQNDSNSMSIYTPGKNFSLLPIGMDSDLVSIGGSPGYTVSLDSTNQPTSVYTPGKNFSLLPIGMDSDLVSIGGSAGYTVSLDSTNQPTSVYTPDKNFSLLPKGLAEDAVSLNPPHDKSMPVFEYIIGADGKIQNGDV